MELPAVVGLAPAVLHAINAAGVTVAAGGVAQSVGAAAATSAGAAVYAAEVIAHKPMPNGASTDLLDEGCGGLLSPAGVSSLRLTTVSEQSTPPTTPHARSEHDVCTSSCATPVDATQLGGLSASSSTLSLRSPRSSGISPVDVALVVARLQSPPNTGQVVAWAFECAAELSQTKRAPPVSLFAALWPATLAAAPRCTAQDVLDMAESWVVLTHRWPRHFRFPPDVMQTLTKIAFPAAVKRMSDSRLAQLARVCRDIASYRVDPALSLQGRRTPSARDMMQPIFALVAAEVAWRLCDAVRYVSPTTVELVLAASSVWRWTPVPNRDEAGLENLKEATLQALHVLRAAA